MLKLFKNLRKKEWIMILISVAFICVQVWLDLRLPEYMGEISVLLNKGTATVKNVLINGGFMMLCAIGSMISSIVVGFFVAQIAGGFSATLREKVFNKVMTFSSNEIKQFSTASLITRTTNDVSQVQMMVAMGMQAIIKAPILATWAIIKMMGKSWRLSMATFVAVTLLAIVIVTLLTICMPKFKKMQELMDGLNRVTRENLTGIRVVRACNAENFEANKFEGANEEVNKNLMFSHRVMGIMSPTMSMLMNGLTLAIYWITAVLIKSTNVIPQRVEYLSQMQTYTSWAIQIVLAFMMLIMIFMSLPRVMVSAKRINQVLDTKCTIVGGNGADSDIKGKVEFKNVSFRYFDAEEDCLKNIDLTVNKGETLAIIGSTGSGKSSLINLIPRFYDVTSGEVLVDGVNVKDYTEEQLHNKIGYISQKAVLFEGSIADNISMGDRGSEKPDEIEVKNALDIAQSSEFVFKKEEGANAYVAQYGANLSGGQKQRLSIARALARDPEILIFDDSFSALDYRTDKALRKALKDKLTDTTCIIVAQRIGTIKNADQIIVLDNGEIVGKGTHEQLLQDCKVYQEIALSQLNKEELENG